MCRQLEMVLRGDNLRDGGTAPQHYANVARFLSDGNDLGEGGGRALAEPLRRLNTTVTSLDLSDNGTGEEVRSVLRRAWGEGEGDGAKFCQRALTPVSASSGLGRRRG